MLKYPMSRVSCRTCKLAQQPVAYCHTEPFLGLPNRTGGPAQVPAVARYLLKTCPTPGCPLSRGTRQTHSKLGQFPSASCRARHAERMNLLTFHPTPQGADGVEATCLSTSRLHLYTPCLLGCPRRLRVARCQRKHPHAERNINPYTAALLYRPDAQISALTGEPPRFGALPNTRLLVVDRSFF